MSETYNAALEIVDAIRALSQTIYELQQKPEPQQFTGRWTCPECSTQNVTFFNPFSSFRPVVCYCETERGGCGDPFAVQFTLEVKTDIYALVKKS